MKKLFALSASAAALAVSFGTAAPASAQEGNFFTKLFSGGAAAAEQSDTTDGKAPGPMPASRMPIVRKNAIAFMQKHGCNPGDSIYFRVYKPEHAEDKGSVDVLAQCGGSDAPYKLLETWQVTETNGVMHDLGYKLYEGDRKVPEGMRTIRGVKDSTNWYLGINFGYPDALDSARPLPKGKVSRGGLTLFHGPYGSRGCVPLSIAHIELAYGITELASKSGAPIHIDIFPSKDMSVGNLKRLAAKPGNAKYLPFWLNMAELDKMFQQTKMRYSIVPHGSAYAFAHDLKAPLVAVAPAEILKERPVTVVDVPEKRSAHTIVAALQPVTEPAVPLYNRLMTTPVNLETGFKKAPPQKINVLAAKPAQLTTDQLTCMFSINAKSACEPADKKDLFFNPETGETRKFVAGKGSKGDSLRGFIPVTDTERLMEATAVQLAQKSIFQLK